ncbi:hypothetical protein MMC28_009144 [Mycoblastus sanguinarius]|nr:hypothetical protein [Mycoblastus sanguinarius]
MPHHPVRTLNVYDKGSNYLILDTDDTTPIYNAHFTPNTHPHITVTRPYDPEHTVGTATYFQTKKGFFATASNIELTLPQGRKVYLNKDSSLFGRLFTTDKRAVQTVHGLLYWKG